MIIGVEYWKNLIELLDDFVAKKTISADDLKLFIVTDSIDEAVAHIQNNTLEKYHLVRKKFRPFGIFGENG